MERSGFAIILHVARGIICMQCAVTSLYHSFAAMAFSVPKNGGYDCKFVDTPPDKLKCQICLLVAGAPHQVMCCGRVYCKACLEEHKKNSRTCPNCRKRGRNFPDIRGE